jgi:hypothetical protein
MSFELVRERLAYSDTIATEGVDSRWRALEDRKRADPRGSTLYTVHGSRLRQLIAIEAVIASFSI